MKELKNDCLKIAVSTLGAELQSIQKVDNPKEYLWQGDPEFWPRRSPVLFPIVGAIWEGKYRTEGETFEMGKHGFARDTEFQTVSETDSELRFRLTDSEESRRMYPYHFIMEIAYRLEKNTVHVIWYRHNPSDKEIHFQIGGHPAFYLPDIKEGEEMHGTFKFDNEGELTKICCADKDCVLLDRFPVESPKGIFKFTQDTFKGDAVIIDKSQLHKISIIDKDKKPYVTVGFEAPVVGMWSPYGKNAPFVCIEPWYGLHDHVRFTGKFKDKDYMNHLLPGASFSAEFTITIEQ